MKKFIFIIIFFTIIVLAVFINTISSGDQFRKDAFTKAKKIALQKSDLKTFDDFYLYSGIEQWHVITGRTDSKTKMAIWIPKDSSKEIVIKEMTNTVTEGQAINIVKSQKKVKKIVSSKLGMEDGVALWEITYINEHDRYYYYYMNFENGDWIKSYENL